MQICLFMQHGEYGVIQYTAVFRYASPKTEVDDGIAYIPVPVMFKKQPAEVLFFPGKSLVQRIQKQTFAKAPGAGQEIISALIHHLFDDGCFVNIVICIGPHDLEDLLSSELCCLKLLCGVII
jgi:hypothetical protein